jgi:hypothetical protein
VNKERNLIGGWGTQTIPHGNDYYRLELSVGDLDNDGTLEVVASGVNTLKPPVVSMIISVNCRIMNGTKLQLFS